MKNVDQRKRARAIVNVAAELREDSLRTPNGLDPNNWTEDQLSEIVEDCTGYKLSDRERRLSVVSFVEGAATAKKCIWYP